MTKPTTEHSDNCVSWHGAPNPCTCGVGGFASDGPIEVRQATGPEEPEYRAEAASKLLKGVHAALSDGDMDAAAALIGGLAFYDPKAANAILAVLEAS